MICLRLDPLASAGARPNYEAVEAKSVEDVPRAHRSRAFATPLPIERHAGSRGICGPGSMEQSRQTCSGKPVQPGTDKRGEEDSGAPALIISG